MASMQVTPQFRGDRELFRFITFLTVALPITNRVAGSDRDSLKETVRLTGTSGGTPEPNEGFACQVRRWPLLAASSFL
jgi:hypothetical protein